MHELTVREKMILDMAGRSYKYQGARETDIRDLVNLTPTHYYQQLNRLLDRQEAVAYAPMTVRHYQARRRR